MNANYITPSVTLFDEQGNLDFKSQGKLFDHLIESNIDGILILGSIGEFYALSLETRKAYMQFAHAHIKNRTRLIVGTTSLVFDEIISFSNDCLDLGVDAVMILPPYYSAMDSSAVYLYYSRLSKEIHGNIYMYNFPDRTGYSMDPETVARLAHDCPNIIGIKDTIPGFGHTRELIKLIKPSRPEFEIYSGFDDNCAHNVLAGGNGCIAGLSNVFPEICHAWVCALRNNDMPSVSKYQKIINELFDIYSVAPSLVPVIKEGVRLRGLCASHHSTFPVENLTHEQCERVKEIVEYAIKQK